ncbi:Hypothetical protein PHPALM_3736 [Phytophthora palmivora]|uniref:Uncharacterized protein n=1 Tax=Phytophthora palmivora TaxID=4796 RepID=A0A2P4YLU3_9STRA|nr:Hypothetical protein PHPALM_3736 [Phytophthora palmivora]
MANFCGSLRDPVSAAQRGNRDLEVGMKDNKADIEDFRGTQSSKTLKGLSTKCIVQFAHDLVMFMKDVRREEGQPSWLEDYLSIKATPEKGLRALMRLSQRFAARHGFPAQKPQHENKNEAEMYETH